MMNRRTFTSTAAAGLAFPFVARRPVLGANDRIRLGFVGVGGRAEWLIKNEEYPGAEIVTISDCNVPRMDEVAAVKPSGERWGKYRDYREMFDKEKLDAVFVETTTHARVLICIHAMQAGLDVYAEKPMTLTVEEGRVLERAVRHYERVLQCGSQMASMPINIYANKLVRDGALGKLKEVSIWNLESPVKWKPRPAEPMPEGLDWDAWCNQTPLRPYHSMLHRDWGRWWDYDGGGLSWGMTGWGVHTLDQVHRGIGAQDTGPVEIRLRDRGPDSRVTMRYPNGTLVKLERTTTRWPTDLDMNWEQFGCVYIGEEGVLQLRRGNFRSDPPELKKGAPEVLQELQGGLSRPGENRYHIENFLECMRSRKQPNADVETAHRAGTACFLVNICRELQRNLKWDPKTEKFVSDEEANSMLARPRRKGYELPKIG